MTARSLPEAEHLFLTEAEHRVPARLLPEQRNLPERQRPPQGPLMPRNRSNPLPVRLAWVPRVTDSLAPSPLAGEGWGEGG